MLLCDSMTLVSKRNFVDSTQLGHSLPHVQMDVSGALALVIKRIRRMAKALL